MLILSGSEAILQGSMEIPAASLAQVQMMNDGQLVEIPAGLCQLAKEIEDIPVAEGTLRLRLSEVGECLVVYQEVRRAVDDALLRKQLVTTWDIRQGPPGSAWLDRIRKVTSDSYDLAGELDRLDERARRDNAHRLAEDAGEMAGPLLHAMRKDRGYHTDRAFISRDIVLPAGVEA